MWTYSLFLLEIIPSEHDNLFKIKKAHNTIENFLQKQYFKLSILS